MHTQLICICAYFIRNESYYGIDCIMPCAHAIENSIIEKTPRLFIVIIKRKSFNYFAPRISKFIYGRRNNLPLNVFSYFQSFFCAIPFFKKTIEYISKFFHIFMCPRLAWLSFFVPYAIELFQKCNLLCPHLCLGVKLFARENCSLLHANIATAEAADYTQGDLFIGRDVIGRPLGTFAAEERYSHFSPLLIMSAAYKPVSPVSRKPDRRACFTYVHRRIASTI